ncbi:MAG: hypothetical protein DIU54_007745 [Acidobacteriota bacterium]|jgi:hypothetical protein|nr:MAG: hypothetical protein DIU54_07435 [Acidobacteriota bacterium]
MAFLPRRTRLRAAAGCAILTAALLSPAAAHAQYVPSGYYGDDAIGERYVIEVAGTLWNPELFGQISSEQFGLLGTRIDFVDDLGYETTRFRDLRVTLRPTRKSKFRVQYTPMRYTAETSFTREIVFNGVKYPLGVPIESSFDWKVWRLGYEYDFLYRSRGFIGMLAEVRWTQMDARLMTNTPAISPRYDEFTSAKAPLPALGVVARAYPLPALALNFELSGMKVPDIDPNYQGDYFEWDIHGTFNITNNVGVQMGWRKATTFIGIEDDLGDLKFQGFWFGGALRY